MNEEFFATSVDFIRAKARKRSASTEPVSRPHVEKITLRTGAAGLVAAASLMFVAPVASSALEIHRDALRTSADVSLGKRERLHEGVRAKIFAVAQTQGDDIGPSPEAMAQAELWSASMIDALEAREVQWTPPHISSSAFGEVVFEWWEDDRKLTLYFDGIDVEYVRVAGPDVDRDMKDGAVRTIGHWVSFWQWLNRIPLT